MAITYRRDLDRKLTVLEMDTNFEELAKNIVIVPETPWWWLGGLQFRVRATQYPILNIAYSATLPEVDITLDVASAYLRNDIIFANIAGEVLKRTGDISGAVPDIIEETEYLIAIITVPAGATEPLAITAGDMYKENAEWTATKSPVTTRINLASTVLPFAGTYSIETSSPANKDTIILTAPAPVNVVDIALIKHRLKLKAALSQAAQIYVQFFNGANYVSSTLSLTVSKYGFLNTDTTNWQELIIPAADFTFSDTQVTGYRLMQRSSCLGWFLDDVVYQSGVIIPSSTPAPEYRLSPNVADKVQLLRNGVPVSELVLNFLKPTDALTAVTPTNKLITQTDVADLGGDMLKSVYDPTVKNADAFSMGNMVETATKKVLTDTERSAISASKTKTDFLTITQAVDLDDIEIRVNNLDAAVVLKGAWDASVGTFPGAGIAQAGFSYQITVAGIVNGIDFSINDRIIALVDNASTTVYATNWLKADYSDLVASFNGRTGTIVLLNTDISDLMTASTAKATPVDTDIFSLFDTVLKKVTWANIKATLKTYFDTLYTKNFPDLTNKYDDYAWALSDVTTDLVAGDTSPVYATFPFTLNGFFVSVGTAPTGASIVVDLKKNGVSVTDGKAEVASLDITAAPTAIGNVVVGLNGVSTNVAVTIGVAEVSSLVFAGTVTTAGSVDISLNGVITSVAVALNDTAIMVADKIRAAVFTGWTTGGTAATDTVTFTSNTVGVKTDTTYSVGTSAGVTATVTTTTQGVDADTTTTVATKIRGTAFTGWITSGTGTNVVFTANTVGVKTDATYSAGTTGATGTIATTTQGVNKANAVIDATEFTSLTGTSPVVSVPTFVKGDKITAEIVQVGSTIAGKDLKIYLDITRV